MTNNQNISSDTNNEQPSGKLIFRKLTMPFQANPNGDIFGGVLMSFLDEAGAIIAYELAEGMVVTIAVDKMQFLNPVHVGDVVCCYAKVIHIGNSSLGIHVQLWNRRNFKDPNTRVKVLETTFTYVAVSESGVKRSLPQDLLDNKEEVIAEYE